MCTDPSIPAAAPGEERPTLARFSLPLATARSRIRWSWNLVVLVPVFAVLVAEMCGAEWFYRKAVHETIAVPIMVLASAAWLGRAARDRSRFELLVGLQAVGFLMREIHFPGTGEGVYIATAIIGLVMLREAWRADWQAILPTVDWAMVSALMVMIASYAIALLVQRRVFKFIPGERSTHIAFEEVLETAAHLWFLASAFVRGRKATAA